MADRTKLFRKQSPRRFATVVCTAAALTAALSDAPAADRSWGNIGGGTFSTSTNWINGLIAGTNDVAIFSRSRGDSQTTYTVSFSANAQNQSFFVGPDEVTFALGGRTYTTTAINGNEIGTSTAFSSRLTVQNGVFNMTGALTPTMLVGGASGRVGSLILTNNATLTGSPNLTIGTASATGFFTLNGLSGGTATLGLLDVGSGAGGRGTVGVNGPFAALTSTRLFVGNQGFGTMSISTAGLLTNTGTAVLGNSAGSTGQVSVDATARWVQTGSLVIGNSGAGTVNVTGGGSLSGAGVVATLGNSPGASGLLNIDSSGRVAVGDTTIGNSGVATLNVSGGSSFSGAAGLVGASTGGTGRVTVSGPGSAASFTSLRVGDFGAGTVVISGGGVLSTGAGSTVLGGQASGNGYLELTGTGSRWDNTGSVTIGGAGPGTVLVLNGGSASHSGRTAVSTGGRLTVDGLGSSWISNDAFTAGGTGRVEVTNGGDLLTKAATIDLGGTGVVDGAGSLWNFITGSILEVGRNGAGSLSITGGGRVAVSGGRLATFSGGTGTILIDGAGSEYSSSGSLIIGNDGRGTLTVSNGGRVETGSARVGFRDGNGTATISGTNSSWVNQGSLQVNGILDVSAGGRITNVEAFIANMLPTAVGTATIQNGSWTNSGNAYIGGNATQAMGTGVLTVRTGGLFTADDLVIWDNGTVNLSGGEIRAASIDFRGSTFNYNGGGKLRLLGSPPVTSLFLNKVFGTARLLNIGKTFKIDGAPTLESLLILRGGIFEVGALAAGSPLQFDSGTFNLTGSDLTIGNTGLFGDTLVLDDRFVNVTQATNIEPGGRLFLLGGQITSGGGFTNNGEIIVNSGFVGSFANRVTNNAEIRVSTNASAVFAGNVTGAGSFSGEGTKFFRGPSNSVGAIDSPGNTILELGSVLTVDRIRENSLTIRDASRLNVRANGTNGATSRLNLLSVSAAGRIDLSNNALVYDYTGLSPIDTVRGLLATGFNGGAWNGPGMTSSTAATTPGRALGFAEAADIGSPALFAGQVIDSTSVLVLFTLVGDANLDRTVGIDDFGLLASNFNQPSRWSRGDFNFDGTTNIDDFGLIAANFNQSLPAFLPRGGTVPEPSAIAWICAAGVCTRRRRRA